LPGDFALKGETVSTTTTTDPLAGAWGNLERAWEALEQLRETRLALEETRLALEARLESPYDEAVERHNRKQALRLIKGGLDG
jgi:hypothetical protein